MPPQTRQKIPVVYEGPGWYRRHINVAPHVSGAAGEVWRLQDREPPTHYSHKHNPDLIYVRHKPYAERNTQQ